ncbi:hypothetical protein [Streptomyces sp. NPDC058066]|uniref:hypothetical protein n=1 Tax=Streptomyces sp. NPDC058066 TaxID=3346323 RepID=UPI0036EEDD30
MTMPQPLPDQTADPEVDARAQMLINAVDDALATSSYRDPNPVPLIGTAPPVAQPGRPPMSQAATDASALMLAGGAATVMVGGTASVLMYVSQFADPVVCGLVFGAPTTLVLALARLAKKAKGALPDEHHHHYEGPTYQDHSETTNNNRWWGRSSTQN